MTRLRAAVVASVVLALPLGAQSGTVPPVDEQVAVAVLPLPADMRAAATVMGYRTKGKLEVLRAGTNGMNCLALYVVREDFHVACYAASLEPFMLRGRQLREEGVKNVDSVRFKEIADGKLKMPKQGALYSITAPRDKFDAKARQVSGVAPLAVIYVPGATAAETGISAVPQKDGGPWLMFPGTAKAHVMLTGKM